GREPAAKEVASMGGDYTAGWLWLGNRWKRCDCFDSILAFPAPSRRRSAFLRLTFYPNMRMLRLYVYPRSQRTAGTTAGHAGPADPAHADLWTAARAGYRTRHPADVGRRAAGGAWRALSCAPATGRAEVDLCQVGNLRK